ncbi:MAG TPA: zinc-ribbon domain-containing protein [Desulfobacteraceae bacterium]|nr:zinc-ribbon domain-containing protein [Desulfobacteraceae bacterium]
MEITCSSCQARFNIPEGKIPKNRRASFLCPKCKQRIHLDPDSAKTGKTTVQEGAGTVEEYDASNKPFDFLDENARTALVCMGDAGAKKTVEAVLTALGFHLKSPENIETALQQMTYHLFDLVAVDDGFDENGRGAPALAGHIGTIDTAERRSLFFLRVTDAFNTMDKMAAFHDSVNLMVNRKDLGNLETILVTAMDDHEKFYAVFKESLKTTGRA